VTSDRIGPTSFSRNAKRRAVTCENDRNARRACDRYSNDLDVRATGGQGVLPARLTSSLLRLATAFVFAVPLGACVRLCVPACGGVASRMAPRGGGGTGCSIGSWRRSAIQASDAWCSIAAQAPAGV
jgi:hypothetical protein